MHAFKPNRKIRWANVSSEVKNLCEVMNALLVEAVSNEKTLHKGRYSGCKVDHQS